jgi:hypothetical protein
MNVCAPFTRLSVLKLPCILILAVSVIMPPH